MPVWIAFYEFGFWALLLGLAIGSWRYGDAAVRAAAAVLTIGMLATWFGQSPIRNRQFETLQAVPDFLMLIGFTLLAIRWPRRWLTTLPALQLLAVGGHTAKLMGYDLTRMAYAILHAGAAYPLLITLSIGLIAAIRTRQSDTARSATV